MIKKMKTKLKFNLMQSNLSISCIYLIYSVSKVSFDNLARSHCCNFSAENGEFSQLQSYLSKAAIFLSVLKNPAKYERRTISLKGKRITDLLI
jgi:hypothetical protein